MTNIYYDTKFDDDGKTIDFISIGMVSDDGRTYYAVNSTAPWNKIAHNKWLCENVVPHLPLVGEVEPPQNEGGWSTFVIDRLHPYVKTKLKIAWEVLTFINETDDPELWAWYSAYDHVVLCQLFGPMSNLPSYVPMYTNDIKQEANRLGNPQMPKQKGVEHHALANAEHDREMFHFLQNLSRPSTVPEDVAWAFHAAYEELAPSFGYRTREATAKPWLDLPENNRNLMVAVARKLIDSGVIA